MWQQNNSSYEKYLPSSQNYVEFQNSSAKKIYRKIVWPQPKFSKKDQSFLKNVSLKIRKIRPIGKDIQLRTKNFDLKIERENSSKLLVRKEAPLHFRYVRLEIKWRNLNSRSCHCKPNFPGRTFFVKRRYSSKIAYVFTHSAAINLRAEIRLCPRIAPHFWKNIENQWFLAKRRPVMSRKSYKKNAVKLW